MKRVLFYADTYYQSMICVNLAKSSYSNCDNYLILSDMSVGMDVLSQRLGAEDIFTNVIFASIYRQKKNTVDSFKNIIFSNKYLKTILGDYDFTYEFDSFLFCKFSLTTIAIIERLKRRNNDCSILRFEEGYSDYIFGTEFHNKTIKLFNIKNLYKIDFNYVVNETLYFNPSFVDTKKITWKVGSLPTINRHSEMDLYKRIYLKNIDLKEFDVSVIFFEESFFQDGKEMNDLEIVLRIAEIVGKDNLLVKLHPRTRINRFEKYGIRTNKTTGIPWECIQYCTRYDDQLLISICSGSLLYPGVLYGDFRNTALLYNCVPEKNIQNFLEYKKYITNYCSTYKENKLFVPKSMEQMCEKLKTFSNKKDMKQTI